MLKLHLTCNPIGYFHTLHQDRYEVPRQPGIAPENKGKIILNSGFHFEQALEGLEKFDRIWVLFWFHHNTSWKPKVMPPRGGKKQGVFATRSPHRPNFIGMSCLELKGIHGLELEVQGHDLLDGTPILDIKPYIDYADSFVSKKQGWLDDLQENSIFSVEWSEKADSQAQFLNTHFGVIFKDSVELRLRTNPYPYPNNRIKKIEDAESRFIIAHKTWRIRFHVDSIQQKVVIESIFSGYDADTLAGLKPSRWGDVPIHREFNLFFV